MQPPTRRVSARNGVTRFGWVRPGVARFGEEKFMPKHRPPIEVWRNLRRLVWERDGGHCQGPYCKNAPPLPLNRCHIDHIQSGKRGSNAPKNLRVLCRRCHVLRADMRHRGMIAAALRDGIIPPNWRRFVWDHDHFPTTEIVGEMHDFDECRK